MNTFKFVRFTDTGRAALIAFLADAYGVQDPSISLDLKACETEAIDAIESDINAGNNCGQWEVSQFRTASKRPELFRAYLGSDVEIYREEALEE